MSKEYAVLAGQEDISESNKIIEITIPQPAVRRKVSIRRLDEEALRLENESKDIAARIIEIKNEIADAKVALGI